jgi:acyl carrier protein
VDVGEVMAEVVFEVCGIESPLLVDRATLKDLEIDSLDMLEIAMLMEERTGIEVQTEDFEGVETYRQVIVLFERAQHDH